MRWFFEFIILAVACPAMAQPVRAAVHLLGAGIVKLAGASR